MEKQQVIAMGGGFSMEPENLLLDRYIIEQAKKNRPSVNTSRLSSKLDFIHFNISIFETGSQTCEIELNFSPIGKNK
jgi:hypothetical protein